MQPSENYIYSLPSGKYFNHLRIIFMWNGIVEITKRADVSTKVSQEERL